MAGCDPGYLPVLIAAVDAVADPRFNLQGIQATTNPAAVWIIVNGPLARRTRRSTRRSTASGEGAWANATLGRALRLVLQNIGGALPGEMDRATQGQPGKYTFCCAENEAESPWEPLHVERGFARDQSTVTRRRRRRHAEYEHACEGRRRSCARIRRKMSIPPATTTHGGEPWLVIAPEHAEMFSAAACARRT